MLERPQDNSRLPESVRGDLDIAHHGDEPTFNKGYDNAKEMGDQLKSNDSFSKWLVMHPVENVKDVSLQNGDLIVAFDGGKTDSLIIHFNDKGQYVSMESDPAVFSDMKDFEGFKSWLDKFLIHIEVTETSRAGVLNKITSMHDRK